MKRAYEAPVEGQSSPPQPDELNTNEKNEDDPKVKRTKENNDEKNFKKDSPAVEIKEEKAYEEKYSCTLSGKRDEVGKSPVKEEDVKPSVKKEEVDKPSVKKEEADKLQGRVKEVDMSSVKEKEDHILSINEDEDHNSSRKEEGECNSSGKEDEDYFSSEKEDDYYISAITNHNNTSTKENEGGKEKENSSSGKEDEDYKSDLSMISDDDNVPNDDDEISGDYDEEDDTDDEQCDKIFKEERDDSDVSLNEIERMLEADIDANYKGKKKQVLGDSKKQTMYQEREKIILEEIGKNHFEVLPEDWVIVTHNSGMPVYLHKKTRACTLSRPYFLGTGSARKHNIPISSIPCFNYGKQLAKLQNDTEAMTEAPPEEAGSSMQITRAKIETAQENLEAHSVGPQQLREYCSRLFKFKTIKYRKFKSWTERRKYTKEKNYDKKLERSTLPEGTKLLTIPVPVVLESNNSEENTNKTAVTKREWVLNPSGKSYVCILHEYLQHAMKAQPTYVYKELENSASPYSAAVKINNVQYGDGVGSSKKAAKSEAAKATLRILIPELLEKMDIEKKTTEDHDYKYFDDIKVEDPRVSELCAKTCEPSPHAILLNCLQRNFGMSDKQMTIDYDVSSRHQNNEFRMTVGEHTVKVICKNKRDGKQRASQAILQILHPHITSWGSLLRMYGSHSVKTAKEKKQEEQEITHLQTKAATNTPNYAILDKLREEMLKLSQRQAGNASAPSGSNNHHHHHRNELRDTPSTSKE